MAGTRHATVTASATEMFFRDLAERGHEPLLRRVSGRLGVELKHGREIERWMIRIDQGELHVRRGGGDCDCRLRTDRELFDRLVTGQANVLAAVLRGAVVVSGDLEMLIMLQRLFPGPAEPVGSRR